MIKIVEDGMEFVMEYSNKEDCDGCELSTTPGGCHFKSQEASFLCGSVTKGRGSKMRLICTSAKKITEEAKVYFFQNRHEASHLIGKAVEWHGGGVAGPHPGHSWERGVLKANDLDKIVFQVDKFSVMFIREIPQRHLTWPQIQALHDDLADVVLVEEDK